MSRDEPQFLDIYALPWRGFGELEVAQGLDVRVLSHVPATGAATFMARLPAGWHGGHAGDLGTLECFVLEGDLTVDGSTVMAGGVVSLPAGRERAKLSSHAGAHAYVFWNPGLPATDERISRVWQEPWIETRMPGVQHGNLHKSLRTPDPADGEIHGGPGGVLRLVNVVPGWPSEQAEVHHRCWEELLILSGDILMAERGWAGPGTYLANPADFWHGPWTTQRGNVHIVQTVNPVGIEYRGVPGGREFVEGYLDTVSWLEPPAHRGAGEVAVAVTPPGHDTIVHGAGAR